MVQGLRRELRPVLTGRLRDQQLVGGVTMPLDRAGSRGYIVIAQNPEKEVHHSQAIPGTR